MIMTKIILALGVLAASLAYPTNSLASELANSSNVTLEAFTMMPMIRSVSVSPDGKKVAILRATTKNGDYVIEIRDPFNLKKEPVVLGASKMMVSSVGFLNNEKIGVSFRQILEDGNSKRWVNEFAITDADGKGKWVIPSNNKRLGFFQIFDLLPKEDNTVLALTDVNDNRIPDVVRYNLDNGSFKTVMRGNTEITGGFVADADGDIRAARGFDRATNSIELFARRKGSTNWKKIKTISPKSRESYDFLGFSKESPNDMYISANLGQDKTGIYTFNIETGEISERLFGLKSVDAGSIIQNKWGSLLGYSYTTNWPKRYFTDPNEDALYQSLEGLFPRKFVNITSRSNSDDVLVVQTSSNKDPGTFYIITNKQKLDKIGGRLPLLTEDKLADVKYISYSTRDGRKIRAYVTTPNTKGPHPAIVLPHGGPWVRDTIIFDEWAQLLAANGYVVIQPNYRGSTGYGLEHWVAGDNNWGLKMQDDLDDAAMYLVEKGYTTIDKLAMFGWSYGGYAAFAASMREKNIYQCTVAGAGVSDLSRINATLNEDEFLSELQQPTITGISPIDKVEKVNIPIMVIHGDIDERVPVVHSRKFVTELEKLNKVHKYVELEDADHFYDTLFHDHKNEFYSNLINWLDNDCGLKN